MIANAEGASFIILTHNPDIMLWLPDNAADIVLCGHTHGGQVYMPFNMEFRFMRSDILPKEGYKYGYHYYKNKNRMFITCGLGCSFMPIRFKTTAEIVFVHF